MRSGKEFDSFVIGINSLKKHGFHPVTHTYLPLDEILLTATMDKEVMEAIRRNIYHTLPMCDECDAICTHMKATVSEVAKVLGRPPSRPRKR